MQYKVYSRTCVLLRVPYAVLSMHCVLCREICQIVFKEITPIITQAFTNGFQNMQQMYKGAENWMKTVKSCSRAFKKIRIRTKKMKTSAADKRIRERIKLVICGKDSFRCQNCNNKKSEEGQIKAFRFKKYTYSNSSTCMSAMWK